MILSFIFFMILFLGGIALMGIAHSLPDFQGVVFSAGIALFCLALAFMMREGRSGATRRSNNWDGGPGAS
jgi:multisubunit Na+/H+ antiporter MnhB subunit